MSDSSHSAFWLWNISAETVQVSGLFLSLAGLSETENTLSLAEWVELFSDKDQDEVHQSLQRYLNGDRNRQLNFTVRLKNVSGANLLVNCTGDVFEEDDYGPVKVMGQLLVQESVSNNGSANYSDSHLLSHLLNKLPYSIYFKDRNSRFLKISRDCAEKFGLSDPEDAVGKTDFDIFDDIHASEAFSDEKKIIESGNPIFGKIEIERKPGDDSFEQWGSTTKLPLYDGENRIIGTFGITKDITAQIEAEQALIKSEQKYRSIFENIQDVYYRTDANGIIMEISPSIEKYSGYRREDVIGMPVSEFYYNQSDRENLITELKKNGVVFDFEIRIANTDDKVVQTSVSAKVIRNSKGEPVAVEGIMRDITERKRAESTLQETQNFYTQMLSSTSEGIYVVDSDLKYIFWNSTMEKISGYKGSDVLGKKPTDLFSHVGQNGILKSIKGALSGSTSRSGDYFYEIKETGKSGWVQAFYTPLWNKSGKIDSALVTISDITQRKVAEDKLRKGDEILKKLSEQVPGAIYQFQQFPDGTSRLPFASQALHSVYELYPEEVKDDASEVIKRIHSEDMDEVLSSINESYNTLQPWEQDYRVNLPQKGIRWLRGRSRPEKQADGSVIWHGYIFDITEKKQKANELKKTLDIISDQNSRLTNFAHIVSHNLRNHAGNISSLLSLYEQEPSDEEKEQLFGYLNMASKRLNEAISDLNEIIDQQAGNAKNIRRISFNDYLVKIREILSTDIINHNVRFEVSIPKDLEIDYNPAYLESILLNLVSNAIKYRDPEKQRLTISVSIDFESSVPVLSIEDNGLGIDLEKYGDKLFGMYNTFHKHENSKGIGLYITKNQVESLGGSIEVESEVGKGTTFRIWLKCDAELADIVPS